jgi:hypothetical protein
MASGSGTMTPVAPGVGVGLSLGQPLPYTLLSLTAYAKTMGITPAHFWGASAYNLNPQIFPVSQNCSDVWYQYSWQAGDRVSRYDVADTIKEAEFDIAMLLGYWPASVWIANEEQKYPRPYRRNYFGSGKNVRDQLKSVDLNWGKLIEPGRRATTLIGTATTGGGSLAYTDEDGDGFFETATVSLNTTVTDECEVRIYHASTLADPEWEIREPRSKSISGGVLTLVFDSWLFVDPDLYEQYPDNEGGPDAIDITDISNYVTSVDVYREYVDASVSAVEFHWEPSYVPCDTTDDACGDVTQNGCMRVRDADMGVVAPNPASWNADDLKWDNQQWEGSREPDRVFLWYRAGLQDERYLRGLSCSDLSYEWAKTIAWLATARLERPPCSCNNVRNLYERLSRDVTETIAGSRFFATQEEINNPFGTKIGEIAAWKRIAKLAKQRPSLALA